MNLHQSLAEQGYAMPMYDIARMDDVFYWQGASIRTNHKAVERHLVNGIDVCKVEEALKVARKCDG